jgi:hypothetical protein
LEILGERNYFEDFVLDGMDIKKMGPKEIKREGVNWIDPGQDRACSGLL